MESCKLYSVLRLAPPSVRPSVPLTNGHLSCTDTFHVACCRLPPAACRLSPAAVTDRESGIQVQYYAPFNVYSIGLQAVLNQ